MWVVERPLSLSGHSNCSTVHQLIIFFTFEYMLVLILVKYQCACFIMNIFGIWGWVSHIYKILPSALPLWPVWPLYWPWLAKCNTSISSVTLKASQDLYILSLLLFAPLWYFLHFPCQIIIHWWLSENWTNLDMKFHLIENTMKIPPNFIFLDSKKIPWSMKNEFEFESTIK